MGEKIAHLYHSVPNVEQLQNEVYPKTLMQQMEDVKELAEKDPLTGLLNYRSFQKRYHSMIHDFEKAPKTQKNQAFREVLNL